MKTKHTPGPWGRNIKPAKKYGTIYAGRNTHICHLSVGGLTDEEIEGNCDLITAAPDLLLALQGVMSWFMEDAGTDEMPRNLFDAALSAIKKAKGEQE